MTDAALLQSLAAEIRALHAAQSGRRPLSQPDAARLALVFHALDARSITDPVDGATMDRAASFLRRQERHAMALYLGTIGGDNGMTLAQAIARSILASGLQGFNRRELVPRCKAFRHADEATRAAALTLLCDYGRLTTDVATVSHGAHWNVDRRVHERFAAHGEAARRRRDLARSRFADDDGDTEAE